ncbi:hypothetical protein H5410_042520 [Solanum commersonii]|uniref:Uncharacterized protein n=1 Tax=Solanum commersonii TaxID=4109 RepID=A0A9J5XYT5_SOLCO|nr:hypothetical protein H5410_042520 [Solanum commersonii]
MHDSIRQIMSFNLSFLVNLGLQKDVKRCLDNAKYLKDRLHKEGISVMLNELSIIYIVVLERPRDHEFVRRWQLSSGAYLEGAVGSREPMLPSLDHI